MSDLDDILRRLSPCKLQAGASSEIVALAEREIGMRLPVDYLELMQHSNGVEAFLGGTGYLVLWPMEQLTALNEGHGVQEFAPGLLFIGSNGGTLAYAYDAWLNPMPIISVPFIGMSRSAVEEMGQTMKGFIERVSNE